MDVNSVISNTIKRLSSNNTSSHISSVVEMDVGHNNSVGVGREAAREDYSNFIKTLNRAASKVDQNVSFDYHKPTNRIIMKITDPSTNEVVKQIPSKDMVELLEDINQMVGLLVDEKR